MNERRKLAIAIGAGALTTAFAAFAQKQSARSARIGIIGPGSASSNAAWVAALLVELRALGHVEGKNLAFLSRWAETRNERLPALAAELLGLDVDVILAIQSPAAVAAKQATQTIPIVMAPVADPVTSGLVASLARPGGNVTGLSGATSELAAKTLELRCDMLPPTRRAGVLANADDPFSKSFLDRVKLAGRHLGIALTTLMVRGEERLDAAFEEMVKAKVDAVIVQPGVPQKRAVDLAIKHRLPAVAPAQVFADAGGLMAYAGNSAERFRGIAFYLVSDRKPREPHPQRLCG